MRFIGSCRDDTIYFYNYYQLILDLKFIAITKFKQKVAIPSLSTKSLYINH